MRYLKMNNGMEVSALALGTWGMGGGTSWGESDDALSVEVVHRARDLGVNLVDTAPAYGTGHGEAVIGKALKGRRGDYVLSTKCSLQWRDTNGVKEYERDGKAVYRCFDRESLRLDLEGSLERLGTDYIDIYILHRQPEEMSRIPEVYETLAGFKKAGKIRAIGISKSTPAHLEAYLKCGPVDVVQEKFSPLDSGALDDYIPLCQRSGVVFQAFSVLERGLLTGAIGMDYVLRKGEARNTIEWLADERKRALAVAMLEGWKGLCGKYGCTPANLVFAYAFSLSPVLNLLFGARRMESVENTVKFADLVLDADDAAKMREDIAKTVALGSGK